MKRPQGVAMAQDEDGLQTGGRRAAKRRRVARRTGTGRGAALAVLLLAGTAAAPGLAQGVDCGRLRAAIRDAESDNAQRDTSPFARAAEQQQREIDRTRRYADQLGCGQGGGFFGSAPPECADIEDRLGRMEDNLSHIEDRAANERRSDNGTRQAALLQRYNAFCAGLTGSPATLPQDGGEEGFQAPEGGNPADTGYGPPDDLSTVPLNGSIMDGSDAADHRLGKAVCVRTCDGGYFPLAPRAAAGQLDGLEQLCKASCPGTEAKLYTMRGDNLSDAVAVDGSRYTALPAAFQFEKSFSPSCSCRPPGQSWAQALAGAEALLIKSDAGDRRDITVTSALSDEMARPLGPPAPKGKAAARKPPPAAAAPDGRAAAEGARGAQAPTASSASSGIGGPDRVTRTLGKADGLRINTGGPDGVNRQIRLIVP